MTFKNLACSLMLLGLAAVAAQAGTMSPSMTVSAHYDNSTSFTPLPLTFDIATGRVNSGPGLYAIDVAFTATPAADEKGWLNTLFNSTVGPTSNGATMTLGLDVGWNPTTAQQDINGAAPGGLTNVFATNQDGGVGGDLQNIIASLQASTLSTTASDTRNLVGTAAGPPSTGPVPAYLGTFYVNWNGVGQVDAQLTGLQYTFTKNNGTPTTFTDDFGGQTVTVPGVAASAGFGAVPEPATLSLLGLAMVAGLGLIRRR